MKSIPIRLSAGGSAVLLGALAAITLSSPWGQSSDAVAYAAPKAPTPKKAATPAPSRPASEPSDPDQKALMKLVDEIRQKVTSATTREKKEQAARDGITTLQRFARDHARAPIADSARLTAATVQLQLGRTDEGLAALREIVAHPVEKKAGQMAQLMLADALAQSGKVDEAEKLLNSVVAKNEDPELTRAAQAGLASMSIRPGRKPPAFTAKDTEGKQHTLDNYEGKVLLIDFWATWCPPCREELPNVKKVYEQYKDQGFAILGVSLDKEQAPLDAYVKEQGISWPQIYDGGSALADTYAVTGIPRMVLVDRQGVIRYLDARGPALEKAVAELVKADQK